MYDNKILDYYIEHPDELRWSKAWLRQHFNCTAEGRKICGGKCCIHKTGKIFVKYYDTEWKLIPDDIKEIIKPHLNSDRKVIHKEGVCTLVDFCLKYPKWKPRECKLTPLSITKKGVLRVSYQKICATPPNFDTFNCPMYKKGPEVWVALKDNLIDLFGEEFYDRLESDMNSKI